MATGERSVEYSDRLYGVLLLLYPANFRARFGPEIRQVFREWRREADGGDGRRATLWFRTLKDLVVSLPAVWRGELLRVTQDDSSVRELVDSLVVPMVVVAALLVAGHTWAILTRNLPPAATIPARSGVGNLELLIAAGIGACALGIAGVLSAFVVARCSRTERPWIKP